MPRGKGEGGPHPVDRHVGQRISERRTALGYNQSDLGRALDVTFQQVQKYEKGTNRVSASKLWRMAQFFGVDVGYFFEGLRGAEAAPGMAEAGATFDHEPAHTRQSLEICRLAPQLSPARQRLVLDMIREMANEPDKDD